jgi:Sortase domain
MAGAGVACIVAGVLVAVMPDGPADVGVVPPAAANPSSAAPGAAVPSVAVPAGASNTPPAPAAFAPGPPATGTVPVAIALPDRGVSAPVVPTGTDAEGALVIPDPPTTVGWWAPGALAGAPTGTTVLAGHVDSAVAGIGTFAVLRGIDVGERVVLTGADGRTLAYRIVARRQLGKADLPADLFARDGPPRLVLVTCGGRFDRTIRHYTDNVIIYAEPA